MNIIVSNVYASILQFVMSKYKDQKIQKTSFLDKAFMKTLAGAVRFGTTLLVENVEKLDPVLNPILNKEIQRTGGRSLVRWVYHLLQFVSIVFSVTYNHIHLCLV